MRTFRLLAWCCLVSLSMLSAGAGRAQEFPTFKRVKHIVALDWVPPLGDPLFDISAVLDDTSTPGGLASAFTGYRARPPGSVVLVFIIYWTLALWWLRHAAKGAGR